LATFATTKSRWIKFRFITRFITPQTCPHTMKNI
jgi:hypothetical protein